MVSQNNFQNLIATCISRCAICWLLPISMLGGCSTYPLLSDEHRAPIRFLLTFDDGPSGASTNNPTARILDVLEHNETQPGIKVIFFAQTRSLRGGDTDAGRELLQREYTEGHLLALHTATPRHSNHRYLSPDIFEQSLRWGIDDLTAIVGEAPRLVRPPFWSFDKRTLADYHRHGLKMLLTDLSAHDGVIHGVNWSWRKHVNLLGQLRLIRRHWRNDAMPVVDGATPIVVTFHDPNSYTARNLEVYLRILLEVAADLHMPVAAKPFYDNRAELEHAALARTHSDAGVHARLPGIWNWFW